MNFVRAFCPVVIALFLTLVETKFYRPPQFHPFKGGLSPHYEAGNPTSRHKNHCAYVVEKTMSFTVQDSSAPYVKAEYNKCPWGQKCPTLLYRLMYKPIFKVAHKTVTELEWRCCPGFSGYTCMQGPTYHHRMMPPFKGPPMKGPTMKGPQFKGPRYNPPVFKGQPINTAVKASPWAQPNGPPTSGFNPYPMHHFGPPRSSSYPDTSFEPHLTETEPLPDHQDPFQQEHEHEQIPEHNHRPEEYIPVETARDSQREPPEGQVADGEMEERLLQIEEDVQRLSQGLETLKSTVNGLEGSLRASLREDANRMLSTLLSAAPAPVPAPAVATGAVTLGFVEIPGADAQTDDIDGRHVFPSLAELREKVDELTTELHVKTAALKGLKDTVTGQDSALKKLSNKARTASHSPGLPEGEGRRALENMMDAKLSAARTEILGGFERRIEIAESRCEEKAGDVHRQCQKEHGERQKHIEESVESTTDLKMEMKKLQLQINDLEATSSCCSIITGLVERVELLETSMAGLNQSQGHLRVEMSGHKDHVEGILEGRLAYLEEKLNVTGHMNESERRSGVYEIAETRLVLEDRMEGKLRALEGRLLTALEELGNATALTVLEGHVVPTLETALDALRERLEMDVDRMQKQLNSLEMLCSSSYSSPKAPSPIQGNSASFNLADGQNISGTQDIQDDRLNRLNVTLQNILKRLMDQQEQTPEEPPIHGELTILKLNVFSVNRTLRRLQESLGTVVYQVDQANSSWHDREARLAQQIKGVVQLVSRQASMLGAGERRLTRLKGELLEMRRRLADEVRGCRSTALGVQKEVSEVGGRVASVENKCKGLTFLAEDLERIREELEKQSTGLLLQVNGTLSSHTQQLSELKDELKNCTSKLKPEAAPKRGDTFTLS